MVKSYPLLKPFQTVCNSIVRFAQSSQVDSYSPELMDSYKDNLDTRCSSGEICKEYHRFQLRVIEYLRNALHPQVKVA